RGHLGGRRSAQLLAPPPGSTAAAIATAGTSSSRWLCRATPRARGSAPAGDRRRLELPWPPAPRRPRGERPRAGVLTDPDDQREPAVSASGRDPLLVRFDVERDRLV